MKTKETSIAKALCQGKSRFIGANIQLEKQIVGGSRRNRDSFYENPAVGWEDWPAPAGVSFRQASRKWL